MTKTNYAKLRSFSDSGHGWLRVPLEDVRLACLQGLEISRFSYMTKKYAYLEEDCDLSAWINFRQIPDEVKKQWKHSWVNGESHIRRYERFKAFCGKASGPCPQGTEPGPNHLECCPLHTPF